MTPRLTIVMPLKGRHLFTFRFLWHANKARLPYRFLLADGQVNEAVARRLEDSRKEFPELDIEYVRYPDDTDYSRYFAKMFDAMQRVRTPYVMHADNDDLLGFHGIERALDFLDANTDYVCARGRVVTFSVYSGIGGSNRGVSGRFNRFVMHGDSKDVVDPTATERLRQGGLCNALYYAIYRTAAPVCIWREITEIDFSDMMLHENFYALRALTLGKVHTNKETISYYGQAGTGISYRPLLDWASHLLRSRFTSDAHAAVARISLAAANADGADAATIAEDVRTILENYYRAFLSMNYGLFAQIKRTMRKKWPRIVNYAQTCPRFSVGRERAAILTQLKHAGASQQVLMRIRGELAEIESALSPEAFADFAGPFLPIAHSEGSREWL
ncbi:MAG: TIGR00180 family glycosyltransferase [Rhizobiales bacterium]|nr:TIGR00180 family glycosyltransferase [Hyphomicrobiales bacterium]